MQQQQWLPCPQKSKLAAASAGKDELKLAAKRVRDAKRAAREAMAEHSLPAFAADDAATEGIDPVATVAALQQRIGGTGSRKRGTCASSSLKPCEIRERN